MISKIAFFLCFLSALTFALVGQMPCAIFLLVLCVIVILIYPNDFNH